jgi:hypothetical protein
MSRRSTEELIAGMQDWAKHSPEGRSLVEGLDMPLSRNGDAAHPVKVEHLLTWATRGALEEIRDRRVSSTTLILRGNAGARSHSYSLKQTMRVMAGFLLAHGYLQEGEGYNDD